MTTEAENKALIREFQEDVVDGDNLERIDEFVAEDFVGHSAAVPQDIRGPEGYRELFAMVRNGFPDFEATIEDIVAEDEKVVQRVRITGTHEGQFLDIPPTGQEVDVSGIDVFRIENGKIVESWEQSDMLGLMEQLGVGPGGPE